MTVIEFTVMGQPKAKPRHRTTKKGFTYPNPKGVEYENLVKMCFVESIGKEFVPLDKSIAVNCSISCYFLIPKSFSKKKRERAAIGFLRPTTKPDLDNIAKSFADSLNKIAFHDDSQIVRLLVEKFYSERPRVEVSLQWT